MNFNRYCRSCGYHIDFTYGEETSVCPICDKTIVYANTIAGFRRDARVRQLKAMHELMCEANDEEIYGAWVYTMPDEPTDEDFVDIAIDDKAYNECFDTFVRLISNNGNRY